MKNQNLDFKKYGDWLFEQDGSSIIYEKYIIRDSDLLTEAEGKALYEQLVKEGILDWIPSGVLDATQLVLAGVGFIPGAGTPANAINVAISIGREDWLGTVLGTIGLIPAIGGAVAGLGSFLRTLAASARAEGAIANLASSLTRFVPMAPTLTRYISAVQNFVLRFSEPIVNLFRQAALSGTTTAAAGRELVAIQSALDDIPAILRPLQSLLENSRVMTAIRNNPRIADGVASGFRQLENLLARSNELLAPLRTAVRGGISAPRATGAVAGNILRPVAGAIERGAGALGSAASRLSSPGVVGAAGAAGGLSAVRAVNGLGLMGGAPEKGVSTLAENVIYKYSTNEAIYTDTRFKKLAGIK